MERISSAIERVNYFIDDRLMRRLGKVLATGHRGEVVDRVIDEELCSLWPNATRQAQTTEGVGQEQCQGNTGP